MRAPITLVLAGIVSLAGCVPPNGPVTPTPRSSGMVASTYRGQATLAALQLGGPIAEESFRACIQDALRQGLGPKQAVAVCETKLLGDASQGFSTDVPGGFAGRAADFSPSQVISACGSTDVRYASGGPKNPSGPIPWTAVDPTSVFMFGNEIYDKYGSFTYGGDPSKFVDKDGGTLEGNEIPYHYQGMTWEQVVEAKRELVEAADKAWDAYEVAFEEAAADPKNQAKQDNAQKKFNEATAASEEAGRDPNFIPLLNVRPSGQTSTCETVMETARELLRECNRNGWKSTPCQQLQAKMNGCADPTLILVDPEAGYTCGAAVDPKAVAEAWRKRCEQLTRPGPDGGTPCSPPSVEGKGFVIRNRQGDVCTDPQAYVDPASGVCIRTLAVDTFGQPNVQSIIDIALGRLGGPTFVLPSQTPPPPHPGPEPQPGPR